MTPNLSRKGAGCKEKVSYFPALRQSYLAITKASRLVIVDHTDCLHEGITDGRADKFETTLQQIFAERVGDFGASSEWCVGLAFQRLAVYEPPNVLVKAAKFALHCEKSDSVSDGGVDLESVANDAIVF